MVVEFDSQCLVSVPGLIYSHHRPCTPIVYTTVWQECNFRLVLWDRGHVIPIQPSTLYTTRIQLLRFELISDIDLFGCKLPTNTCLFRRIRWKLHFLWHFDFWFYTYTRAHTSYFEKQKQNRGEGGGVVVAPVRYDDVVHVWCVTKMISNTPKWVSLFEQNGPPKQVFSVLFFHALCLCQISPPKWVAIELTEEHFVKLWLWKVTLF